MAGAELELKELINLELWENIQNKFAEVIGFPIVTMDAKGNEIVVSKKRPLFCELIREKREDLCKKCKLKYFKNLEKENKGIVFYFCHAGMMNIMVPIHVEGRQVGVVICDSIKKKNNSAQAGRIAKEIGISPIDLMESLKKMDMQKREDILIYGTFLHTLSNTIPNVVYEKYKDEKQISELKLLQNMGQTLSAGLELPPIINSVIEFFEKNMKTKASVILVDEGQKKKYSPGNEKITDEELSVFEEVVSKGTYVLKKKEKETLLAAPLKAKNSIIGAIILLSQENISSRTDFVSIIADQTALAITNALQYEEIKELAITDKLTGVFNRRELMNRIDAEMQRAKMILYPISILMLDFDEFSDYNNTFGHPEGDLLLSSAASVMKSSVREIDTIGRYGGEEFTVILPRTSADDATQIAEKIRQGVESIQAKRKVTISIGIANCLDPGVEKNEIIKVADDALYEAKRTGRNKVVLKKIIKV
jgi:diguanylate cyclase (GGDEF)-like protein